MSGCSGCFTNTADRFRIPMRNTQVIRYVVSYLPIQTPNPNPTPPATMTNRLARLALRSHLSASDEYCRINAPCPAMTLSLYCRATRFRLSEALRATICSRVMESIRSSCRTCSSALFRCNTHVAALILRESHCPNEHIGRKMIRSSNFIKTI